MATVYKVEVVSHWINYTKEELQKLLQDAINRKLLQDRIDSSGKIRNEINIKVK
jgi:Ni,Fe-hydrogenase III large subunit